MRIVPIRERLVAGRMKRFARMLSVMLAWSWMPGIDPESPVDIGVANTSSRPDAVNPMNTILSLKTAGSILGVFPVRISCSAAKI